MTAVSNYFTPTESLTDGEITRSGTGHHTSPTQTGTQRYTPTSIPPNSGTGTGAGGSGAETASASKNVAATGGVNVAGGILAAGLGAVVLL